MTSRTRTRAEDRTDTIVEVLGDAFADLMASDPVSFRRKFRRMASDPHAFYRGTACLFYSDVVGQDDPFADDRSARIWVHGDLHVENFGTYLNADGVLVFDVNDFDEAYLGSWTWDLRRFAASLALVGWQKALPPDSVTALINGYVRAYVDQVRAYAAATVDDFSLHLGNTSGPVHQALQTARSNRRSVLLDAQTDVVDGVRRFREDPTVRALGEEERFRVMEAFKRYLDTIPDKRRQGRELFYDVHDLAGKTGFGIGSAGLPAYNVLLEGHSQAFENDVLLSLKQANVPAISRFVDTSEVDDYFEHEGHRTVVSQRALQAHTDPLLGYTDLDGVGFVVAEVSPYEEDLDWGPLTEPEEIEQVVGLLGRATAKIHCASDEDSDQDLVDFQVEEAVLAGLGQHEDDLVTWVTDFGVAYAEQVRRDHALFVDAFRGGGIGVSAT